MSLFSNLLWYFQNAQTGKDLVSYCYDIKEEFCLKISDSYLYKNKSNVFVKNEMLYSENANIMNIIMFG